MLVCYTCTITQLIHTSVNVCILMYQLARLSSVNSIAQFRLGHWKMSEELLHPKISVTDWYFESDGKLSWDTEISFIASISYFSYSYFGKSLHCINPSIFLLKHRKMSFWQHWFSRWVLTSENGWALELLRFLTETNVSYYIYTRVCFYLSVFLVGWLFYILHPWLMKTDVFPNLLFSSSIYW